MCTNSMAYVECTCQYPHNLTFQKVKKVLLLNLTPWNPSPVSPSLTDPETVFQQENYIDLAGQICFRCKSNCLYILPVEYVLQYRHPAILK